MYLTAKFMCHSYICYVHCEIFYSRSQKISRYCAPKSNHFKYNWNAIKSAWWNAHSSLHCINKYSVINTAFSEAETHVYRAALTRSFLTLLLPLISLREGWGIDRTVKRQGGSSWRVPQSGFDICSLIKENGSTDWRVSLQSEWQRLSCMHGLNSTSLHYPMWFAIR